MASEGNHAPAGIVQFRKRGPGRCIICGETWTDRYVGAQVCTNKKCHNERARGRTQASEKKEGE